MTEQGRRWLLAIDTATATIVVAAGTPEGEVLAEEAFEGRYRHSQELLPAVERVLRRAGLRLADLAGLVAGTGPGAFTGLRVGLAAAKTLAHELDRPIVGVSTAEALLAGLESGGDAAGGAHAGGRPLELWLPSGPRDRVVVTAGSGPRIVHEGASDGAGARVAAVDLDGRAPEDALELGRAAVRRLGTTLLRLGAERLARGESDDVERLVPAYASAPRGAPLAASTDEPDGGMAWSRDPR